MRTIMAKRKPAKPVRNPWPAKLIELRERWGAGGKKLPQELAAERIGVTRRSWISWEHGERIPLQPVRMLIDLLLSQED